MSARAEIASKLWWSVPSVNDADAKARTEQMIDAYRAEVLAEAAANETIPHEPKPVEVPTGDGDTVTLCLVCGQLPMRCPRWDAPPFYQPGHTYTDAEFPQYGWKFRCDSVTTHPEDGERTALGWRFFKGQWEPYSYGEDDWDVQRVTDVTGGVS